MEEIGEDAFQLSLNLPFTVLSFHRALKGKYSPICHKGKTNA